MPVRSAQDGVSTEPSVARIAGRYVVVTKAKEFLDPDVVALVSDHPWGPWPSRRLSSAPSTATDLRYSPAPAASSVSGRLVVVCRTSPSWALLHEHAQLGYPTFYDVRLTP